MKLNANQRVALEKINQFTDWFSIYDFSAGEISGHTLNALARKGLLLKRQRPGYAAITEFKCHSA